MVDGQRNISKRDTIGRFEEDARDVVGMHEILNQTDGLGRTKRFFQGGRIAEEPPSPWVPFSSHSSMTGS